MWQSLGNEGARLTSFSDIQAFVVSKLQAFWNWTWWGLGVRHLQLNLQFSFPKSACALGFPWCINSSLHVLIAMPARKNYSNHSAQLLFFKIMFTILWIQNWCEHSMAFMNAVHVVTENQYESCNNIRNLRTMQLPLRTLTVPSHPSIFLGRGWAQNYYPYFLG